jgi:hypothetical protein
MEKMMDILIKDRPENWAGIQINAEEKLEEVFLISYSERYETKVCWKRLKSLS